MNTQIDKAIRLLRDDNLVWDEDFEAIRQPLANLLDTATQFEYRHIEDQIDAIVSVLMKEEPSKKARWTEEDGELTIPDVLEEWDEQTKRQIYIYQALTEQSKATRQTLKKLFGKL
jgi:hypothetical protein